jgi:phosphate starvation-inducible PhoH-like protein
MDENSKTFGELIIKDAKGRGIYAKTHGQLELIKAIDEYDITFVSGPAGCGKTFLALAKAAQYLKEGHYDKIIITRPAVESGESLGFLPGELGDKIAPYMKPLYAFLEQFLKAERKAPNKGQHTKTRKKRGRDEENSSEPQESVNWASCVEISPLAYMRGTTLNNAIVIMDEAQNVTKHQMKMFLTRMGDNSKFIITGDETQTDLPLRGRDRSGFDDAIHRLSEIEDIGFVRLDERDIVRHRLIRQIIRAYDLGRVE